MSLLKSDAEKLVGKRITVTYTQRYTNGRSETLTQTGKLVGITGNSIEIHTGYTTMLGFRSPVYHLIGLDKISEHSPKWDAKHPAG